MAQYGNYIFKVDPAVKRTSVQYHNRYGIKLSADLYTRVDLDLNTAHPALVLGGPNTTVKEQTSGLYANELAKRGFVTIAFDYSFTGYSGGMPRNLDSPEIYVEDVSAAVDYLRTLSYVAAEQIGALGVCASGGYFLSAAQVDTRIKAVATVSMYNPSDFSNLDDAQRAGMLADLAVQRDLDFAGDHPALGAPFAPVQLEKAQVDAETWDLYEYYRTPRAYHPLDTTQITATSYLPLLNFPMLTHLDWISPRPILLIAAEHAPLKVIPEHVYQLAKEPKELYIVPGAHHMDLYDKTDIIPFDKIDSFFKTHLA